MSDRLLAATTLDKVSGIPGASGIAQHLQKYISLLKADDTSVHAASPTVSLRLTPKGTLLRMPTYAITLLNSDAQDGIVLTEEAIRPLLKVLHEFLNIIEKDKDALSR